jgi:SAM-dependent methyltransferase
MKTSLSKRGVVPTLKQGLMWAGVYVKDAWLTLQIKRFNAPIDRRSRKFDRKYGVNTHAMHLRGRDNRASVLQDIESANRDSVTGFGPVDPKILREALDSLAIDHSKFSFIDFGCGSGRAVLMASEFPYKKIVGVEFAPRVFQQAEENIRAYKSKTQKCKDLEAVCMDATKYPIPSEPIVLYMANPFTEDRLWTEILDNLKRSHESFPREGYILYVVPKRRHMLDNSGFLQLLKTGQHFLLYKIETHGSTPRPSAD